MASRNFCWHLSLGFLLLLLSPQLVSAEDTDVFRFFLVRSPEILEGTPCQRSDPALGVVIFSPEVNLAKYSAGGDFTVIFQSGDRRAANLQIVSNASDCHVFTGSAAYSFELLKFNRPMRWVGSFGEESLLAYSGKSDKRINISRISEESAPAPVQKDIRQLAGGKKKSDTKISAQVFSFTKPAKKYGVIITSIIPDNYAEVGDKGIRSFTTVWEIVGQTWKRTNKVDGAFRILYAVDAGGVDNLHLVVNEIQALAGTYKIVEFKNGKLGDTVQKLYEWMD